VGIAEEKILLKALTRQVAEAGFKSEAMRRTLNKLDNPALGWGADALGGKRAAEQAERLV
jgi:hypothetical protein